MINKTKKSLLDIYGLIKRTIPAFIIIYTLIFPITIIVLHYLFSGKQLPRVANITLITFSIIAIPVVLFIYLKIRKKYFYIQSYLNDEIQFVDTISAKTSEILIHLDEYGRIKNFNNILPQTLQVDSKEILGKPFRYIFNTAITEDQYTEMVLDKLKYAFTGQPTEMVIPIQIEKKSDPDTIFFKLIPTMNNNELQSIFVIGKFMYNDYITNHWLISENGRYIMTNDIALISMFCYRLTRNLENKLTRTHLMTLQVALQEVLLNSIEHGNLAIDYDKKTELKQKGGNYWEHLKKEAELANLHNKKIYVDYELNNEFVKYVIKDDGEGFMWKDYFEKNNDLSNKDVFQSFHGLGLHMVNNAFDEIKYNEKGNTITLIKFFR